jgi:hypothetical protein
MSERTEEIKEKVASTFMVYKLTRDVLSKLNFDGKVNPEFSGSVNSSQLSNICFNKIIERFSKRS